MFASGPRVRVCPVGVCARQVHITVGDLDRLQPSKFLNDNLVDFYLKYMTREQQAAPPRALAAELGPAPSPVHVFSTSFYEKLTEAGASYANVARWTKDVDVFSKRCRPLTLPYQGALGRASRRVPPLDRNSALIVTRRRGVYRVS